MLIKKHLMVSLLVSMACIAAFDHFFYVAFVSSGSMLPTIAVGDGVLILRQDKLDQYDYADLVVFRHPAHHDELWLKRLVAKPKDTLAYHDHQLWLNARHITFKKNMESFYPGEQHRIYHSYLENPWGIVTIPEGYVFLMGDNRGASEDSRIFGGLPEGVLFGKVIWCFWKNDLFSS